MSINATDKKQSIYTPFSFLQLQQVFLKQHRGDLYTPLGYFCLLACFIGFDVFSPCFNIYFSKSVPSPMFTELQIDFNMCLFEFNIWRPPCCLGPPQRPLCGTFLRHSFRFLSTKIHMPCLYICITNLKCGEPLLTDKYRAAHNYMHTKAFSCSASQLKLMARVTAQKKKVSLYSTSLVCCFQNHACLILFV